MRKFINYVLFSLLLAVGWTNGAQAQNKEMRVPKVNVTTAPDESYGVATPVPDQQQSIVLRANAPKRTQDYDLNASAVHPKSWYENQSPVTWGSNSALLTDTYTDAEGMMALLKRIYTDPNIPGAKWSAPRNCDLPYQTIQHGWNIIGTNYNDAAVIEVNSSQLYISKIEILNGNGTVIRECTPSNTSFPSTWTTVNNNNYWHTTSSSGGAVSIPAEWLQNDYGYAEVKVYCRPSSSTYNGVEISVGNATYDFYTSALTYESGYVTIISYDFPGTITPPYENGYTICLVKLIDGINNDPEVLPIEYTTTTEQLQEYFTTYIKEIQILTDGMRVGSGDNAGTMFSYTGDLNRFFLIGKGKMFYYSSIDKLNYDRAPFYSMFEEFSANDVEDQSGYDDFYTKMKAGESYPILHDCMGVNFRQHYFSMSGKNGTTENHVSSLVFFIPDHRGVDGSDWRNYDENHQPEIGMYTIELDATAQASTTTAETYTVTVTWESNLQGIADGANIDQSYRLFETVTAPDGTVTTREITLPDPHQTSYTYDVPQYDSSYKITYYVIGTPDDATNKDVFFSQSNDDFVVIPGLNDFIGLKLIRYESDYVVNDGTNTEVNYYRNFLAPKNLDELGLSGVTAANVGTDGRTFTLYRDDKAIADIEIIMQGEKAYYRITYREGFQQIEPGYDENGNKTNN